MRLSVYVLNSASVRVLATLSLRVCLYVCVMFVYSYVSGDACVCFGVLLSRVLGSRMTGNRNRSQCNYLIEFALA